MVVPLLPPSMAERPSKRGRVKVEDDPDAELARVLSQIAAMEAAVARLEQREQIAATEALPTA